MTGFLAMSTARQFGFRQYTIATNTQRNPAIRATAIRGVCIGGHGGGVISGFARNFPVW